MLSIVVTQLFKISIYFVKSVMSFMCDVLFFSAIFDRLGRYVITGSDDRLVKIWSMETAYCLASCRGHEVSST